MDDLLKGENSLPRSGFPLIRFIIASVLTLPVLAYFVIVTIVKDWVTGGETITSLFGGLVWKSPAGLVQRAASKTAILVTAVRYIGYKEGWTNDYLARHFIPSEMATLIDRAPVFQIGYPISLWFHSGYLMARTQIGDRILLNRKPKQVVLLGAGLDTRAHRLDIPSTTRIYEIDIATTQALKRAAAKAHPDEFKRADIKYISVDFSRESFVEKLKQEAPEFDFSDSDTVVLFEGVSMYLEWEALKTTMEMVSSNFAPGTLVTMDVLDDMSSSKKTTVDAGSAEDKVKATMTGGEGYFKRTLQRLRYAQFKQFVLAVDRIGEPFQWGIPQGESAQSVFSKLGFDVVVDAKGKDMEKVFLTPPGASRPIGRSIGFGHCLVLSVTKSSAASNAIKPTTADAVPPPSS